MDREPEGDSELEAEDERRGEGVDSVEGMDEVVVGAGDGGAADGTCFHKNANGFAVAVAVKCKK